MSQYLAESARVLKAAEANAEAHLYNTNKHQALEAIASGYATLAAIDKGLLPADITEVVLRAVANSHATR